jgi:hypothetical protein
LRRTERVRVVRCWKVRPWEGGERREERAKVDRWVEVGERSFEGCEVCESGEGFVDIGDLESGWAGVVSSLFFDQLRE